MAARRKKAKRRGKKLRKQLRRVVREAKKLDAHIQALENTIVKGGFRIL